MFGFGSRKPKPSIVIHRIGVDVEVFYRAEGEASRGAGWTRSVVKELPRVPIRGEYVGPLLENDSAFALYRVDAVRQDPLHPRDGRSNVSQVFTTRLDGRAEFEKIAGSYKALYRHVKS